MPSYGIVAMPMLVPILTSPRSSMMGSAMRGDHLHRQLLDRRPVLEFGHDDGEFVAAEPGEKLIVLQPARDQMRDFPEQFVAGGVAERNR